MLCCGQQSSLERDPLAILLCPDHPTLQPPVCFFAHDVHIYIYMYICICNTSRSVVTTCFHSLLVSMLTFRNRDQLMPYVCIVCPKKIKLDIEEDHCLGPITQWFLCRPCAVVEWLFQNHLGRFGPKWGVAGELLHRATA